LAVNLKMKRQLVAVSLVLNVFLLALLLWMRAAHQEKILEFAVEAMRGDRFHLQLHARSVAALESGEAEQVEETAALLRKIVESGEGAVAFQQRAFRLLGTDE
jgi:hypothetical protein